MDCAYGVLGDTAVIEMAGAAGLPLVPAEERDPLRTTTYGVGEVIADAIAQGLPAVPRRHRRQRHERRRARGCSRRSASACWTRREGTSPRGAQGLKKLARIETAGALPALAGCRFRVACDVTNPLCGEKGASAVFGPQKGARPADIPRMDAWLAAYAQIAAKDLPRR